MKLNFQFYKNIILVLASALTLVAVTFAWFSTATQTTVPAIESYVGGDTINVKFYSYGEDETYSPLVGDIELNDFVPGQYNRYKLVVKTGTNEPIAMNFGIVNLPEDMPDALKNSVSIKYELKESVKTVDESGNETYIDGETIAQSTDYQKLSAFEKGEFFTGISLGNYQSSGTDTFVIYYEIGLGEDSSSEIENLSSSLGNVKVSAQRIG